MEDHAFGMGISKLPRTNKHEQSKILIHASSLLCAESSKRTVRTLAQLDMEKINFDLILALLKWIVGGDHEVKYK
jgi:hypothetical protein